MTNFKIYDSGTEATNRNPYVSSLANVEQLQTEYALLSCRELRVQWRIVIAVYGFMFLIYSSVGTIADLAEGAPLARFLFWLTLSLLTSYGVFALAIPSIRISFLARPWLLLSFSMPFVVYIATYLEDSGDLPPMSPVLFLQLSVFLFLTLPAFVLNIKLALLLLHRQKPKLFEEHLSLKNSSDWEH